MMTWQVNWAVSGQAHSPTSSRQYVNRNGKYNLDLFRTESSMFSITPPRIMDPLLKLFPIIVFLGVFVARSPAQEAARPAAAVEAISDTGT